MSNESTTHAPGGAEAVTFRALEQDFFTPESPATRPARLHHFFERSCDLSPQAVALHVDGRDYSYAELDELANSLAHRLRHQGVGGGSRVGLLIPRSPMLYVSLLAVLKAGAAFVPIAPESPADRVQFIADDAGLCLVLASAELADLAGDVPALAVDELEEELERESRHRPEVEWTGDPTCYIIYTSGSTGRPKGVEIEHSSICNFINVVPKVYDVRAEDRVYQGMVLAFDFSIEEVWPTWAVGATLVAGPHGDARLGTGLGEFLVDQEITVFYCVPTLLATLEHDLPRVRSILVGGEACPRELVERWSVPGRRMLNTYGPTEGTVTCTWGELHPDRPVTIGRSLPTYDVRILDEDLVEVPPGETGEICISGPGVARGYVNLPDVTRQRFREHAELGRVYRTGDLGRVIANGEIEYLGRADSEVKIRGHRADLQEVENVLRRDEAVADVAVMLLPGGEDLAAYLTLRTPVADERALFERLHAAAAAALPPYMKPAFFEVLASMPMMPSGKVNRKGLPAPTSPRFIAVTNVSAAESELEERIARTWRQAFNVPEEQFSVEADFFMDLGGHSLLAATVASEMRREGEDISIADIYAQPTVRALARYVETSRTPDVATAATDDRPPLLTHGNARVARCGMAQLLTMMLTALPFGAPFAVILSAHQGVLSFALMLELILCGVVISLFARIVLPFVGIYVLGRFLRTGHHPLWGWQYFLHWYVGGLLRLSFLSAFSGTPLAGPYLRLLGARIGADIHLGTANIGLPWMISIGSRSSIGYGASLQTTRVESGWMTIAPVHLGEEVFVGANAHLEPGSRLEDRARLGEQSLAAGNQIIPAGEHWAGSPARPRPEGDRLLRSMDELPFDGGRWPLMIITAFVLGWFGLEILPFLIFTPAAFATVAIIIEFGILTASAFVPAAALLFVLTVCGAVAMGRAVLLRRTPVGTHPIRSGLGVRKWIADRLMAMSLGATNALYATLYTIPWLRLLGARIGRHSEVSTVSHVDPDLLVLHEGSFVADMASVGSAVYHNGHMHMDRTSVGSRSFVGNAAFVPAGTRMGDGSLIGVHSVPPAEVPDGSSWLGSPAMFLPRRQDSGTYDESLTFRPTRVRVAGRLAIEFLRILVPPTLIGFISYLGLLIVISLAESLPIPGLVVTFPFLGLAGGFTVVLAVVLIKWTVVGRYRPRTEPLWDTFVRRSEFVTGIYESAAVPSLLGVLTGTPLIGPVLRLFGAQIGKRTYITTTYLTEFDLVHIDDDACVGGMVSLQTHLFEDRVMKMSHVRIGKGASVGTRAVVLYDTSVGESSTVDALSLVMKGEHLPPETNWRGIPVRSTAIGTSV
jgi:non-ribosomal peptide synthetase-like protein